MRWLSPGSAHIRKKPSPKENGLWINPLPWSNHQNTFCYYRCSFMFSWVQLGSSPENAWQRRAIPQNQMESQWKSWVSNVFDDSPASKARKPRYAVLLGFGAWLRVWYITLELTPTNQRCILIIMILAYFVHVGLLDRLLWHFFGRRSCLQRSQASSMMKSKGQTGRCSFTLC